GGRREVAGWPSRWAGQQRDRYSSTLRFCWRQVATTVRIRSTNRLPDSLSVPPLVLRYSTACRSDRSASLLVGSIPSTRTKVRDVSPQPAIPGTSPPSCCRRTPPLVGDRPAPRIA